MRILFVMNAPNLRLIRQAIALHSTGRHELFLYYSSRLPLKRYLHRFVLGLADGKIFRTVRNDQHLLDRLFTRIDGYRNLNELRMKIQSIDVDLIHAHAEPNIDACVAIQAASVPVIFDPTDITSMRFDSPEKENDEIEAERYCFENAAGYIHKGPEIEYVHQKYGFSRPTLHLDNYCIDEWVVHTPLLKLSERDGEWHVVFTGGIAPLYFASKNWSYKQYDGLAEILGQQHIHLHLYLAPNQSNALISYRGIAGRNPYLHLHETIPPDQIAREISRYDFGAWIHPRTSDSIVTEWMWNTAIGNKFYTYLEAGIPLIVNDDIRYGSRRVREQGVGLVFSYSDICKLKEHLDQANIPMLVKNIRKAREELLMNNHVNRLEAFYETVLSKVD